MDSTAGNFGLYRRQFLTVFAYRGYFLSILDKTRLKFRQNQTHFRPDLGMGWAGLGWAGPGWAGLGWAGRGWTNASDCYKYLCFCVFDRRSGWAGLGWAGLGRAGLGCTNASNLSAPSRQIIPAFASGFVEFCLRFCRISNHTYSGFVEFDKTGGNVDRNSTKPEATFDKTGGNP